MKILNFEEMEMVNGVDCGLGEAALAAGLAIPTGFLSLAAFLYYCSY